MPAPVTEGQRQRFESLGGDWGRLRSVQFYRSKRDPTWLALSRLEQRQRRALLEEAGYGVPAIDEVEAGLAKVFPITQVSGPGQLPTAQRQTAGPIDWEAQRRAKQEADRVLFKLPVLGTFKKPYLTPEEQETFFGRGSPMELLQKAFDPVGEIFLRTGSYVPQRIQQLIGDPNAPQVVKSPFARSSELERSFQERPIGEQLIGGFLPPTGIVQAPRAAAAAAARLAGGIRDARRLGAVQVARASTGSPGGFLRIRIEGKLMEIPDTLESRKFIADNGLEVVNEAPSQLGTMQSGMGIGEKPSQGGLFENLPSSPTGKGLIDAEAIKARQTRAAEVVGGQIEARDVVNFEDLPEYAQVSIHDAALQPFTN